MTTPTEGKESWNKQKQKLKERFASLTDHDLFFWEGRKEEMLGVLQMKLGKTKEEWQKIIKEIEGPDVVPYC